MPSLPPLESDPVIEAYKKDVDRTLLRENLKLTPEQRLRKLMELRKEIVVGVDEIEQGKGIVIRDDAELAAFFDEIADEADRELSAE